MAILGWSRRLDDWTWYYVACGGKAMRFHRLKYNPGAFWDTGDSNHTVRVLKEKKKRSLPHLKLALIIWFYEGMLLIFWLCIHGKFNHGSF